MTRPYFDGVQLHKEGKTVENGGIKVEAVSDEERERKRGKAEPVELDIEETGDEEELAEDELIGDVEEIILEEEDEDNHAS